MRHELWAGVLGEEENTQRVEGCEGGGQVIGVTPGGRGSLSLGWGLAETLPAVGEGGVWTRFRLRRCSRHQHWPSTPDPQIQDPASSENCDDVSFRFSKLVTAFLWRGVLPGQWQGVFSLHPFSANSSYTSLQPGNKLHQGLSLQNM